MLPSSCVVIFDMDGTLTVPQLDFDQIRREIGIDQASQPLLEAVETMSPPERARAEAVLLRHEAVAAATSVLQPGTREVLGAIRGAGWPVALMTRNSRESVRVFVERHGLSFDLVRTREDGAVKPSPQPVHDICATLGGCAEVSWVIGDFHYDILCGAAAGARTVLLLEPDSLRPSWADEADFVIDRLIDLLPILGLAVREPA